jgi:hypothetical protein
MFGTPHHAPAQALARVHATAVAAAYAVAYMINFAQLCFDIPYFADVLLSLGHKDSTRGVTSCMT